MPIRDQFPMLCLGPTVAAMIGLAAWLVVLIVRQGRELARHIREKSVEPAGLARRVLRLLAFALLVLILLGAVYVALQPEREIIDPLPSW